MFWFLLLAMAVVVGAVTLQVVGGGDGVALAEAGPDRLAEPLPAARPVGRADLETLRLPTAVRGYHMAEVDDVLSRLGAELAERDARIAELEAALAGAQATAMGTAPIPPAPPAPPGISPAATAAPGVPPGTPPTAPPPGNTPTPTPPPPMPQTPPDIDGTAGGDHASGDGPPDGGRPW